MLESDEKIMIERLQNTVSRHKDMLSFQSNLGISRRYKQQVRDQSDDEKKLPKLMNYINLA